MTKGKNPDVLNDRSGIQNCAQTVLTFTFGNTKEMKSYMVARGQISIFPSSFELSVMLSFLHLIKNKYFLKPENYRCLLGIFPNPSLRSQMTSTFAGKKIGDQQRGPATSFRLRARRGAGTETPLCVSPKSAGAIR